VALPDSGQATAELPLTGERTLPGVASENYWFRRHEAAYRHLVAEIAGGVLVEIGSGEGYGAALFAERAAAVLSIDYDAECVAHAARRYPQVSGVRGNLAALPIRSEQADTVAALQVIEHVWDHRQFVAECARILRPGGLLMLTTPNRLTFSPGLDRPANPFHTHEFTAPELLALVGDAGVSGLAVRGLRAGPRLAELDNKYAGRGLRSFVDAQLAGAPESWADSLWADVVSVTVADFVVSGVADDSCLDLILLARRR
jgi:SAM-dependent methyltransferase